MLFDSSYEKNALTMMYSKYVAKLGMQGRANNQSRSTANNNTRQSRAKHEAKV